MPYRRRYKRRYKRSKGRNYYNIANKALNLAIKTKKLLNVEFKHADITPTTANITNSGTLTVVSDIGQGDTSSTRDGDSILLKSFYMRFIVKQHASATQSVARIMIIHDKMFDGVSGAPNVTEIIGSTNAVSLMNLDNSKRFRVLKDIVIPLSNDGTKTVVRKVYIKLRNHAKYAGAQLKNGQILLLHLGNEATNYPTLSYSARIRFLDN